MHKYILGFILLFNPNISIAVEALNPKGEQFPVALQGEDKSFYFQVEIADTPEEWKQGLMHRQLGSMRPHEGMLFVWPRANIRYFWMKNTHIPLDILFFKEGLFIGALENMKPYSELSRTIYQAADMALEVNAGTYSKLGIKKGWSLSFAFATTPTLSLH